MSVFLNNLDDFIVPSQACVNPFVVGSSTSGTSTTAPSSSRITLAADYSSTEFDLKIAPVVQPNLIRTKTVADQKVASVSLNDCLACSGCVTSAETVLIQEQSYEKLFAKLTTQQQNHDSNEIILLAISPQSRASLATSLGMTSADLFLHLAAVLKNMGVHYVVDASSAGDIALIEAREEFMARLRVGRSRVWEAPETTTAASSSRINIIGKGQGAVFGEESYGIEPITVGPVTPPSVSSLPLPMFASSCPGWVCYAEKTQPQCLPYISTTKSPQQIMGIIAKTLLRQVKDAGKRDLEGSVIGNREVFVVSVQPCFDKKLEASRLDFSHADSIGLGESAEAIAGSGREVDLVLSTTELLDLLTTVAASSPSLDAKSLLKATQPDSPEGRDWIESMLRNFSSDGRDLVAATDSNGGSGGLLDYLFRYAAREVCGVDLFGNGHRPPLDFKVSRNVDMAEVVVESASEEGQEERRRLKFGRVYGFRNIQSIMLKMKRGQCDFDFIEIMACPSGCVNGGGQLKLLSSAPASARESPTEIKARVAAVEAEFHRSLLQDPSESPLAQFIYGTSNGRDGMDVDGSDRRSSMRPRDALALAMYHTRYHAVPKLELMAPLAAKW